MENKCLILSTELIEYFGITVLMLERSALESLYGGQIIISILLMKPNIVCNTALLVFTLTYKDQYSVFES